MGLLKSTKSPQNTPQPPSAIDPVVPPPLEYRELLRVLVNPQTQAIVVQADGQIFESIEAVKDKTIGRRILEATAALLQFTGGLIATATGIKSFPIPQVKLTEIPVTTNLTQEPQTSLLNPATANRFLEQLEAQTARLKQEAQIEQAKPGWMLNLGKGRKKGDIPVVPAVIPPFNLADQIDDLVQKKLLAANEPTTVKITTGTGGGIVIQVNHKMFNLVDEVEPETIKVLIKQAIAEWERS